MNRSVDNSIYRSTLIIGASRLKQVLWYFVNRIFFTAGWNISSSLKVLLLSVFGAKVGRGVVLKPCINIKYPWKLKIGNHSWIGEGVWLDNLADIEIGSNVTISQGAYLLTGNHDHGQVSFDLITRPIVLEDGVWIGAKAIVCPGITCFSHSVLAVGSIATRNLEAYTIYQGNPATERKKRTIR